MTARIGIATRMKMEGSRRRSENAAGDRLESLAARKVGRFICKIMLPNPGHRSHTWGAWPLGRHGLQSWFGRPQRKWEQGHQPAWASSCIVSNTTSSSYSLYFSHVFRRQGPHNASRTSRALLSCLNSYDASSTNQNGGTSGGTPLHQHNTSRMDCCKFR